MEPGGPWLVSRDITVCRKVPTPLAALWPPRGNSRRCACPPYLRRLRHARPELGERLAVYDARSEPYGPTRGNGSRASCCCPPLDGKGRSASGLSAARWTPAVVDQEGPTPVALG